MHIQAGQNPNQDCTNKNQKRTETKFIWEYFFQVGKFRTPANIFCQLNDYISLTVKRHKKV